jgi:flagellar biogenesis protein FliO
MYTDGTSTRERLAQLPFGLIIFLMMIIFLSYYFEKVSARQHDANRSIAVQSQQQP